MHFTLLDDSIPFDGFTAAARPLGGAEKAFAALPGALVRRGHQVTVFNRCNWNMYIEGAQWETFDTQRPLMTDVLIAFRKPGLLKGVRQVRHRVLWHTGPCRMLARPATRDLLRETKPLVLLMTHAQAGGWQPDGARAAWLPPAVRSDFLSSAPPSPMERPRAIVTSHPAHGLDWLVNLWCTRVHPEVPDAELHIHSMSLAKAAETGECPPDLTDLWQRIDAARDQGVVVVRPQGDHLMAQAYREARVHLYPGHEDDVTAFTLMESQACGTPAVLRPMGAAPERVRDGASAYVAPDDDAFVNLTCMLLRDPDLRTRMGAEACALYLGRSWDEAARKLEETLR